MEPATPDETRSKVLKRSAFYCRVSLIFILALAGVTVGSTYVIKWFRGIMNRGELGHLSYRFFSEFNRYEFTKGCELAFFSPPQRAEEADAWLKVIEGHLQHPAATFWERGGELVWARRPESPEIMQWTKDVLASPKTTDYHRWAELQTVLVWHKAHTTADGCFVLWMVKRRPDSTRWGVVYPYDLAWKAFYDALNDTSSEAVEWGPVWMLREDLALPETGWSHGLAGMRAYLHNDLVFSTVGLDTTTDSYSFEDPANPHQEWYANRFSWLYYYEALFRKLLGLIIIFAILAAAATVRSYIGLRRLRSLSR